MPAPASSTRLSADQRREAVLDAAVHEFAHAGYHAASTTAIAKRAGISQPYIYALFPNKKALFMGCQQRVHEHIRSTFLTAASDATGPEQAFERMGHAYAALLEDRDELLCQLQGYASAADPDVRTAMAGQFAALIDEIAGLIGVPRERIVSFVAIGMYLNIARALELPEQYTPSA